MDNEQLTNKELKELGRTDYCRQIAYKDNQIHEYQETLEHWVLIAQSEEKHRRFLEDKLKRLQEAFAISLQAMDGATGGMGDSIDFPETE